MALISVIIPTYNRQRTLARALDSALSQDHPPAEIIVVDDGSTDGTADLVAGFGDRVRYLVNPRNMGSQASRNRGVAEATGEVLAFLDSDDHWRQDKLRLQLAAAGPAAEFCVTCGYEQSGSAGTSRFVPPAEITLEMALVHNLIGPTSNMLISRALFEKAGAFDVSMPSCQDWDFFLRVLQHRAIVAVPDILTFQDTDSGVRISADRAKVVNGHRALYKRARDTDRFRALSLNRRLKVHAAQNLALLRRQMTS